ncbi:hypothetical protein ACHAXH_008410 [Discostella pseudostelligera]|jgi:hypothetical protein
MSLMTENLLLHAQSLREEGDMDASIDLLRVVIAQCNSDGHKARQRTIERDRHRLIDDNYVEGDILDVGTIGQIRQMSAYQLALLLLQRSGRKRCNSLGDIDEKEADELLWKLGYRLRLSKMAFGYLRCISCFYQYGTNDRQQSSREAIFSEQRVVAVIDNLLPTTLFDALQNAFRPGSRYWSEFYNKTISDQEESLARTTDNHTTRSWDTNQFASHNIPLPRCHETSPAALLLDQLQRSKSLLEQVAIITQHRLRERFPDVLKATSVEVWSHRRPTDGQHQLHYDMDEIRLWKHRQLTPEERQTKRRKTHGDAESNANIEANFQSDRAHEACNDGTSCPRVSCVLTITVPEESKCYLCGGKENSAPTIICNQSIMIGDGCQSNNGCLSFPVPNRLLAFEGSLLHGVMPGIPFAQTSNSGSEDSDSICSDGCDDKETHTIVNNQRITFMMGFWETVCTTSASRTTTSGERGPNVPFENICHDNTWTEEFNRYSVTSSDIANMKTNVSQANNENLDVYVLCPLWVPVLNGVNTQTDEGFGEYSAGHAIKQHGRYFLKSLDPTEIDNEVLNGEMP